MKRLTISCALILASLSGAIGGNLQEWPTAHVEEWKQMHATKAETIKWFKDAKFGMFIHWGLYSIPAGVWDGRKMNTMPGPKIAEWIQYGAKIPRAEYAELAKGFNPIHFDADAIARLAKRAGMKYLVITTKHHDGFALYDSKVSRFDVMDATPFKRDIIRELYDACKREGLEFGIYYSHNIDWADGSDCRAEEYKAKGWKIPIRNLEFGANTWDPSPNTFQEYLDNKAYPQVAELMEKFPDMKCLWFDMPWRMDADQSFKFYKLVYDHQPQIIITERIGNGYGDYTIPGDNVIPNKPQELRKPWETVGTFNNSWGYSSYDQDWKTPEEILFWLVEIVSKGGNYMLNIGPTGLGGVPQESVDNLNAVGAWIDVNGEAIYGIEPWKINKDGPTNINMSGTHARGKEGFKSKFTSSDFWFTKGDSCLYAISLAAPEGEVTIKAFSSSIGKIQSVEILGLGAVPFHQTQGGLTLTIPEKFDPKFGYTIKVGVNQNG